MFNCVFVTLTNGLDRFELNEREEFMQETQHTQQTATRTAQNQDKKTTRMYKNTEDTQKQTNIY